MQKSFGRGREQSQNLGISFLQGGIEQFQSTKLCILPLNSCYRQSSHNFLCLFLGLIDWRSTFPELETSTVTNRGD